MANITFSLIYMGVLKSRFTYCFYITTGSFSGQSIFGKANASSSFT